MYFFSLESTKIRRSCNIIQMDNFGWLVNGSFNGGIGLFQDKRIDMMSHGIIMRPDRIGTVEFTHDIFAVRYVRSMNYDVPYPCGIHSLGR